MQILVFATTQLIKRAQQEIYKPKQGVFQKFILEAIAFLTSPLWVNLQPF